MLMIFMPEAPEFVIVTGTGVLVVNTCCVAKLSVFAERETAPTVAVPLNPIVWGVPAELFTLSVALRTPPALGVKITLNLQVAPAVSCPKHVEGTEKSPRAVPLRDSPVMVSAEPLLLVMVTDWLPLALPTSCAPKRSPTGDKVRAGRTPTPLVGTFWGLLVASSVIVIVALAGPLAVGVNNTRIEQLLDGGSVVMQSFH
jgi:hypothetical protein